MPKSHESHKDAWERDHDASTTRISDRLRIQQVLAEVGLNPSNYLLSPPPDGRSAHEAVPSHTSAFSAYPSQQRRDSHQPLLSQPHSQFTSARPLSYGQLPAPPPPPPPPQPPANAATSSNPNPEPAPASSGSALPSFLFGRSNSQPPAASSQPVEDMSHHSYSRRSPPLPPDCISHPHDSSISAEHYLRQVNSNECPPVKVVKPCTQNVVYKKEIRIRYLQPPTPPLPAPIIIREKRIPPKPPQSPLLIRERKPEARTPPPLTIRERPPSPPPRLEPYVIEKSLPPPPPQPRQIIIERLPTPPPKPRTVIFEKWLPYKKLKRPVLLQKAPPPEPIKPTRNVVIEYEPCKAFTVRRVIEEGVFRVDPCDYTRQNAHCQAGGDVRVVERIDDLPPPSDQLRHVLNEYNHCAGHGSSHAGRYDHHAHPNISEHVPSSIQHLLAGARPASNADQLTNVSRSSSTPAYQHDRVLSSGSHSSVASPTTAPLQTSRSKTQLSKHLIPHDSPARSQDDDIY